MQICDFLVSIAVVFERRFIALTHFTLYTQSAYQSVMLAVVEKIIEQRASLLIYSCSSIICLFEQRAKRNAQTGQGESD